jgi:hypothetical protein
MALLHEFLKPNVLAFALAFLALSFEDASTIPDTSSIASLIEQRNACQKCFCLDINSIDDPSARGAQAPTSTIIGNEIDTAWGQWLQRVRIPENRKGGQEGGAYDVFDLLGYFFGFQTDNVRNQRDSVLTCLTSRCRSALPFRKEETASVETLVHEYCEELRVNYARWCKHLGIPQARIQKGKGITQNGRGCRTDSRDSVASAVEIAMFVLIWGEAANLRFCPEFLCFVYHKGVLHLSERIEKFEPGKVIIRNFLQDIIKGAYKMMEAQVSPFVHQKRDLAKVIPATLFFCSRHLYTPFQKKKHTRQPFRGV